VSFLRPVAPDGGELLARGTVTHRGDEFLISHVEVTDDAGRTVAVGTQTSLFIRRQRRQSSGTQPLRMLATVLFTDIVGSTERAESLGDARWREVLAHHHALVRKQLQLFKGKEVHDLVTGSGLRFADRGRHKLKGIDGEWQLFALS
jgi:hypothetical protein